MKEITDESIYLIKPETTTIPDLGLGDFIKGYSDKDTPYKWTFLLWLLLPIVGWILVIIYSLLYITRKYITRRNLKVLIYSKGFYLYEKKFNKEYEEIIKFDDIIAINCARTRNYTNSMYSGTSCQISVLDMDRHNKVVFSATYHNENEEAGNYNFGGYVVWALMEAWYPVALERHIHELNQKRYTTFYYLEPRSFRSSILKDVQIGTNFIKVAEDYVDGEFTYQINDGWLYIYPPKKSTKKSFRVYLNQMYDSTIFLVLLKEYWGVE